MGVSISEVLQIVIFPIVSLDTVFTIHSTVSSAPSASAVSASKIKPIVSSTNSILVKSGTSLQIRFLLKWIKTEFFETSFLEV